IAAAAAVAPLVSLARMSPAELYREPRAGTARGSVRVIDGIRYVRGRPDLVMAMALVAVIGFAGFNFQVTLAALSKVVYQTEPSAFGILLTSLAIGSLGGA